MESFCKYLREDLIPLENAFTAEKKAFQEEIYTLRQQTSRIEELENENRNLRSKLNAHIEDSKGPIETHGWKPDDSTHVDSGADGTELAKDRSRLEELTNSFEELTISHEELTNSHENLKNAYGQLVGAHHVLIEAYKLAQQTNRKWDHYYQNVSQRPKVEDPAAKPEIDSKNILYPNVGQQATQNISQLSSSRSLSNAPGNAPGFDSQSKEVHLGTGANSHRADPDAETSLPLKFSPRKKARGAQDIFDIPPDPEPDSLAETCDESQTEFIVEHSLINQREDPVDQNKTQSARPIDDDSDYPIIVAERSLKRKRDLYLKQGNREVNDEPIHGASQIRAIYVKSELDSSSPIAPVSFPGISDPPDSIDLDEVGEKHFTPRKHQQLLDNRRLLATGHEAPVAADNKELLGDRGANDQSFKSFQGQNLDSDKEEDSYQRLDGDGNEEDGEGDQPIAYEKALIIKHSMKWRENMVHKSAKSFPGKALKTADPNMRLMPRTNGSLIDRRHALPPHRQDRSSAHISVLTEDGEDYGNANNRKPNHALSAATRTKQNNTSENSRRATRATGVDQRLGNLLVRSSPEMASSALARPITGPKICANEFPMPLDSSTLRKDSQCPVTPASKRGQLVQRAAGGTKPSNPTRSSLRSRAEAKPVSPRQTQMHEQRKVLPECNSLRHRPLATLRPTDFKLNPAHNQGYDFPFSDVVRNRELRKCMPGCTKPSCCGAKLRKAVEIGGYTAPRTLRLLDSSPGDSVDEDERLLEEYLGDNKFLLKSMPAQEREELLKRARTEQFANVHGRHRYVYGRAPSPPGYWDTDMPDTQREKENRAAASANEMERTAEMYKEAMRRDGLYKFRDE
ncbi:hypothetical protein MMC07_006716 [Pseudocyphellaria aurata]|nr:hypothetical protein [Pseudocyphellaria aurata]